MDVRLPSRRLLVGLSVGVLLAGCAGSGSPIATPVSRSPTSVPSVAPAPAVTPAPSATPANVGATWSTVIDVSRAEAVTAGGPGWIAAGSAFPIGDAGSEYNVAAAWTSTDGRSWTRSTGVAMPEGSVSGEMTAVTSTTTGLIAAGAVDLTKGTIWHSVDGIIWDVIGSDPVFDLGPCIEGCGGLTSIAAGPAGIVVVGSRVLPAGSTEADVWSSVAGAPWQRMPLPTDGVGVPASVASVAARAQDFIAAGRMCTAGGRTCRAVTWTSTDGRTWSAPVDLPNGTGASAIRVVNGPGGSVVLGERCGPEPCRFVVWASTDGASWTEGSLDGDNAVSPGRALLASAGDRLVVLGSKVGEVAAWTSSDGLAWEPIALASDAFPPAQQILVLDIAGRPDGVLAVGDGVEEAPTVWVSP